MKKPQPQNPLLVNQKTLAVAFSVSVNTIVNFDKEGLPSVKQGKERMYSIPACIQWYLQRELATLSSLSEEQARYTKIRRERQELQLAQERGELVWAEDARKYFTMVGTHLKSQLEALPHQLAGRLAGMQTSREISLLLKRELAAVLSSFRSMKLQ